MHSQFYDNIIIKTNFTRPLSFNLILLTGWINLVDKLVLLCHDKQPTVLYLYVMIGDFEMVVILS